MDPISIQITVVMADEMDNNEIQAKAHELTDDIRAYLESMKHASESPWSNHSLITIKSSLGSRMTGASSASRIK